MFVTRKMDYGLRLLLELGCRPTERLTSETLSTAIDVPRQFTLKIAQTLTKAGLIKAQRGVGGGIQLAKPAETITLFEIFSVADTPRALNECLVDASACKRSRFCATHNLLRGIQSRLDNDLKRITLAQLVNNQLAMGQTKS
jgi:Rrf2 family protein